MFTSFPPSRNIKSLHLTENNLCLNQGFSRFFFDRKLRSFPPSQQEVNHLWSLITRTTLDVILWISRRPSIGGSSSLCWFFSSSLDDLGSCGRSAHPQQQRGTSVSILSPFCYSMLGVSAPAVPTAPIWRKYMTLQCFSFPFWLWDVILISAFGFIRP